MTILNLMTLMIMIRSIRVEFKCFEKKKNSYNQRKTWLYSLCEGMRKRRQVPTIDY